MTTAYTSKREAALASDAARGAIVVNTTITASGAVTPAGLTPVTNAGAGNLALTLADGTAGDYVEVHFVTKGGAGNAVITPTNLVGGTAVTLDAAGEYVGLRFNGAAWVVIGGIVAA